MLKQRVITSIGLIALVLIILCLPQLFFCAAISLLVLLAGWEYSQLMKWQQPKQYSLFLSSLVVGLIIGIFLPLTILVIALLAWIGAAVAVVLFPRGETAWHQWPWIRAVTGWLLLVPFGIGLAVLHHYPQGSLWILVCCVIVWATDTGAFFVGKQIGKQPLAPLISPNKTVQGLYGGIVFALVVTLIIVFVWPQPVLHQALFAVLALVVILVAVIGDLFESMIKRWMQVKDSGTLLPGHGGILDRIDSLTAAIPIFALGISLLIN
jgi:phosphatidate cytidylyltransferase